mmetsp:Transcript_3674/g.4197  ORF Transcript_3674/g.4197 Transcript_3674/m.4197 type:complete len:92 (-) Transcript_3674:292-567(-)
MAYLYTLGEEEADQSIVVNCAVAPKSTQDASEAEEEKKVTFACDLCTKAFSSERALVNHRKSHTTTTTEAPATAFTCSFCQKGFHNQENLD